MFSSNEMNDVKGLMKNSFTIIKKDVGILNPLKRMIAYNLFTYVLLFGSLFTIVFQGNTRSGLLVFLFAAGVLVPYAFYFNVKERATQAYLVFKAITGEHVNYNTARRATDTINGSLWMVAIVDGLVTYAQRTREENESSVWAFVQDMIFAALKEVWDLLNNYLVPAVVIEEKSVFEVVDHLKQLKENVPAALVGVFGIDLLGGLLSTALGVIGGVVIIFSMAIAYLIAPYFPHGPSFHFGTIIFSWYPIFLSMGIIIITGQIFANIIVSVKTTYFTIFYTMLNHPMKIDPDLQGELTNYLNREDTDFIPKKKEILVAPAPHHSIVNKHVEAPVDEFRQKRVAKMATFIEDNLKKGHSPEKIASYLKSKNYLSDEIDDAFKKSA